MNDVTENFMDIFDGNNTVTNNVPSNEENIFNNEPEKKDDNKLSILKTYSEDMTAKKYITNPAIARDEEIKSMILILLSPEKSPVLTGKAGIGKTSIVEGLSYRIQNRNVPDALLNSRIYKINTSSLLGTYEHEGLEESKLQLLIEEIMGKKDIILFIDEIHILVTSARNVVLKKVKLKNQIKKLQLKY